jgi:glycerol-3-phosphate O-acyltransferase
MTENESPKSTAEMETELPKPEELGTPEQIPLPSSPQAGDTTDAGDAGDAGMSKRASITPPRPAPTPSPGAMLHRWGLLGRLFARIFFSRVCFPKEAVETIRQAAQMGTVVYVMRLRNTLEFLYFNYACTAHDLPVPRFANGLKNFWWQPVKLLFRRIFGKRRRTPVQAFRQLTEEGQSSAIFLRTRDLIPNPSFDGPYLESLLEIQETSAKPIVIVPLTVFWGNKLIRNTEPGNPASMVFDKLLGNQDEPRMLRRIWQVIRHAHNSLAAVCTPIALDGFLQRNDNEPKPDAKVLDQELVENIDALRRMRLGPRRTHFMQLREQILQRPEVQVAIRQQASSTGQSIARVERKALKILKQMQARCTTRGLLRLSKMIRAFWGRLFEGFEIDEAGLQNLQIPAQEGRILFLPTHRSHMDYLILSDMLYSRGVVPPHIASGINLAFWPMGWIFRTAGAFFMRRRFSGDQLYTALIRTYLRTMLTEAHTLEIFIEGGRTRTGSILPPKLGLLSIVADLTVCDEVPPVYAVPVSIGYERGTETTSLTRELSGGKKQSESFRAMLSGGARILRRKQQYGFVNVQFGEAIEMRTFLAERGYASADTPPEVRHHGIRALGYHVLSDAGHLTAINPTMLTAAALSSMGTRGVRRDILKANIELIARACREAQARFSPGMWNEEKLASDDILVRGTRFLIHEDALRILGGPADRVYASEEEARIRLDYYKNQLLQHVLDISLGATVLRTLYLGQHAARQSQGGDRISLPIEVARNGANFVAGLVRLHFVNYAGLDLGQLMDKAFERMVALSLINQDGENHLSLSPAQFDNLKPLAGLIESPLETQRAIARSLQTLRSGPRLRKTVESDILAELHRAYLTGDLHRYESCQTPLIRTGIDWLCDEGIVTQQSSTSGLEIALAKQHADGRALEVLVERIDQLISEDRTRE